MKVLNDETRDNLRKIIVGSSSFIISLFSNGPMHYALLLASFLVLGYEIIIKAFKNLIKGHLLDENFLMTVATAAAAALGQFNEAVLIMLLYCIGEFAQDIASDKSRDNIASLMNLTPDIIHVNGSDCKPEEVHPGTVFTVLPGERIPIDGVIVKGRSLVDTKSVTGESRPTECTEGMNVISGSIVLDSPLEIKAQKEYSESTASRIMNLIEQSAETKAPAEKFITKFAKYYTPTVVGLALVIAIVFPLINGNWNIWIYRALNFLVVSCPCALVLSVPLAFFAGIGGCAKDGILVKGAEHLESIAKTEAAVFDKTGTLTTGEFSLLEITCANGIKPEHIASVALGLEKKSNHPISLAIKEYCRTRKIKETSVDGIKEIPGYGLLGKTGKKSIILGSYNLMLQNKIDCKKLESPSTVVYVAENGKYIGHMLVGDRIKKESETCIKELKKMGITLTVLLSGDNEKSAKKVAQKLGIDKYYANLLPEEKLIEMVKLRESYKCTYCGDGLNDIPVMLNSDVAISMGTIGSDAAIEASDIVLINDNPEKIPQTIVKAKKTMKIVRENIIVSLLCKIICIILGLAGITELPVAVFADTGIAVLAVLNSLRALY